MIALFYATVKIHKGYPIRPIVSFIDSPTYQLAIFLSKLFAPISNKTEQKMKNTCDVSNCLHYFTVPDGFSLSFQAIHGYPRELTTFLGCFDKSSLLRLSKYLRNVHLRGLYTPINKFLNFCLIKHGFEW